MVTFLKMVGAVIVAFIICITLLALWIRWKIRGIANQFTDSLGEMMKGLSAAAIGGVPPLRIKLLRLEDHEWHDPAKAEEATQSFERAGFEQIGDYEVEPAMMELRALMHTPSRSYAVIYEHPLVGVWFDIYCGQADGSASYTLSTGKPDMLDRRPGHPIVNVTELTTPEKAFEKYLKDRPDQEWSDVTAGAFVKRFQDAYARGMDWRLKRGGPTRDEVKRIAHRDGTEFSEESVELIRGAWQNHAADFYDDELFERFLDQSPMSASEWEDIRERLVFVHEYTSADILQELIETYGDNDHLSDDEDDAEAWDQESKQIREMCKKTGPRQALRHLIDQKRLHSQLAYRSTVHDPLEADVYVTPRYED